MMTIREYVEELFKDIPDSERKENIKQEIIQNLEEKVQDLLQTGKEEEDAINKTIVDFGDIQEIKNELMEEQVLVQQEKQAIRGRKIRNNLGFSIWGSILIIGLFLFINMYYSPYTIWFVYPTFVILW